MTNTRWAAVVSTLGAVLGLSTTASAGDRKVHAASSCVQEGQPALSQLSYRSYGQVFNDSLNGAFVVCPIVRDTVDEDFVEASIVIKNTTGAREDAMCTIQSVTKTGELFTQAPPQRVRGNTWTELTFRSMPTVDNGPYVFRCWLPGRVIVFGDVSAGIASYRVDEP